MLLPVDYTANWKKVEREVGRVRGREGVVEGRKDVGRVRRREGMREGITKGGRV